MGNRISIPLHVQSGPTIDTVVVNCLHWQEETKVSFPGMSLPPLLRGHSDMHMRAGVLKALRAAAESKPDAEQAFLVADLSRIYHQHLRWQQCLPGIEPFYAVKCNPDPYVLSLLAALGIGFDCASSSEIATVFNIAATVIDPSRIIFANPCKATSSVSSAARAGVDLMTFDNVDELYKVACVHRGAKLVLRILTDDSKARFRLGLKFGAPLPMIPVLLAKAKELLLDVVGVSFHVGSGCSDPNAFVDAVRRARAAFDMGAKAGYLFSLLDVGGGFEDASFEATASVLMHALDEYFPDRAGANSTGAEKTMKTVDGIRVIAEPGRFYVSQAFKLAVNIIARRAPAGDEADFSNNSNCVETKELETIKESDDIEEESDKILPRMTYYINDGVYGVLNCARLDPGSAKPYVLSMGGSFDVPATAPLQTCCVWGPTCDSRDCVFPSVRLPRALRVGDWLAFDNMGAYTLSLAGHFNGFEVSKIIYTTSDAHAMEVRAALAAFAASQRL